MKLILQNLQKSFHQMSEEIRVLKGLEANISDGEVVAVVGQSGSGKSTLLSLMAGLDKPDSGKIFVNGTDITLFGQKEMTAFRAINIGFVFQQFHLMSHLTALENVMLPLEIFGRSHPEKSAQEMLEKMNLSQRLKHFPSQLSGGECQRVAIARALVVKPNLLLADEPSGNLDIETGTHVMDEFFSQVRQQKVTTVLVTHSDVIAQRCDRKLRLQNGILQ